MNYIGKYHTFRTQFFKIEFHIGLNFIVIEFYELVAMVALADMSFLNKNATWNSIFKKSSFMKRKTCG